MKPDQERVRLLLAETVTLLCKNGLQFNKQMKIEGLLGITLDESDVFLVHIDEKFNNLVASLSTDEEQLDSTDNIHSVGAESLGSSSRISSSRQRVPKVPIRPVRPTSRFGHRFGHETPSFKSRRASYGQSASKSVHGHHNQNGRPQRVTVSASSTSLDSSGAFDIQRNSFAQSADGLPLPLGNEEENKHDINMEIKAEEEDDVIVLDQKVDTDALLERQAMLGSYLNNLTEASVVESSLAQEIFSEFSLAPVGQGAVDNSGSSGAGGSDGATSFHAARSRNFQMGDASMMDPSSWDIQASSQASSSFSSSGQRANASAASVGCVADKSLLFTHVKAIAEYLLLVYMSIGQIVVPRNSVLLG